MAQIHGGQVVKSWKEHVRMTLVGMMSTCDKLELTEMSVIFGQATSHLSRIYRGNKTRMLEIAASPHRVPVNKDDYIIYDACNSVQSVTFILSGSIHE